MAGNVDTGWGGGSRRALGGDDDDEFDSLAMEPVVPTNRTPMRANRSGGIAQSMPPQSARPPMGRGQPIPVNNNASMPDLSKLPPPPSANDDVLSSYGRAGGGAAIAASNANNPSSFPAATSQSNYAAARNIGAPRGSMMNSGMQMRSSSQMGGGGPEIPSWGWPFAPSREIPKVNRERRCYIITIITFVFICLGLAIGIILGLQKREQQVRGSNTTTQGVQSASGPCCARAGQQVCEPSFSIPSCNNQQGCPTICGGTWLLNPLQSQQCCSAVQDGTCDPEFLTANCTQQTCGVTTQCGSGFAQWINAPVGNAQTAGSTCCSLDGVTCLATVTNAQCNTNLNICNTQCGGIAVISASQNTQQPPPPTGGAQCCNIGTGTCAGDQFCDLSQANCAMCGGQFGSFPAANTQPPTNTGMGTCQNCQAQGAALNGGICGSSPTTGQLCNTNQNVCTQQCLGQFIPSTTGTNMCCSTDGGRTCNILIPQQCNSNSATCSSQQCQFGFLIPAPFDASRVDITTARYQQLAAIVGPALLRTNTTILQDPETPQARALHWVANLDPVQVRSSDTTNLNARFALSSLFYNTDGPNWFNNVGWLSSANHCNWHGVSCDTVVTNPNNPGNVVALQLGNNNLRGNVPEELFSGLGATVVSIQLQENRLNGTIPATTFPSLSALQIFSAYNNTLSGAIPDTIGNNANLRRIYLENNILTNRIPASIGNLLQLERLDLFNNRLYGSLPSELGNCVNLQRLWLSNNSFWGNLPNTIGNMVGLQELYLDENLFNGVLPNGLGNLNNLRDFRAYTNNFQGNIPTELGQLVNLQILYLDNNRFGGGVPQQFGNLFNLKELSLFNNTLQGQIPPSLGQLANLQVLSLSFNQLNGPIPGTLNQLSNLRVLHLFQNQLQGAVPNLVGMTSLRDIFLYSNQLNGGLPNFFSQMNTLDDVNLSNNQFNGQIPNGISNPSMRSLILNGNPGVTGSIPQSVCQNKQNGQLQTLIVDCQITGCYTSCV